MGSGYWNDPLIITILKIQISPMTSTLAQGHLFPLWLSFIIGHVTLSSALSVNAITVHNSTMNGREALVLPPIKFAHLNIFAFQSFTIAQDSNLAYHQTSDIRCTKSQNLNVSHLVLHLSLPNLLKPGVKSRIKMQLEQRRQAMLQLHLSDEQFYNLLWCGLYQKFDGSFNSMDQVAKH